MNLRVLVFLAFSTAIVPAQSAGIWDSGAVRPPGNGAHPEAVPQLRVQQDWTRYTLEYQASNPAQIKDAWIEVWDRPLLVFRQQVPGAGGTMLWEDRTDSPPSKLDIALLDPDYKPRYICMDNCGPEEFKETQPTSDLVVGVAPDEQPPEAGLEIQSARTLAGFSGLEVILAGFYLTPDTRLLVADFDPTSRAYTHLQFLPFEYVDLQHIKLSIPAFLLLRPRVLVFSVMPPREESNEAEPVFDGTPQGWLPGTNYHSAALIVASPESPIVERLEPSELRADADELRSFNIAGPHPATYQEHGVYMRVHGQGFDRNSHVILGPNPFDGTNFQAEFISPQELRFWIEARQFQGSAGQAVTLWVSNQKQICTLSNPVNFNIIPAAGAPLPVLGGEITITEPYPIPFIKQNGPKAMEFVIRGKNFRPNVTVVASNNSGGAFTKLKTLFVSPEELHAWLPAGMWRVHGLSFRFVVRTKSGENAVEIQAPE